MTWRRWLLLGVVAFAGFVIWRAFSPYSWKAQLSTPAGQPPRSVTFTCGPLFGSGYVHGPSTTAFPVEAKPCGTREQERLMTVVDVGVAAGTIYVVTLWRRRRTVELSS